MGCTAIGYKQKQSPSARPSWQPNWAVGRDPAGLAPKCRPCSAERWKSCKCPRTWGAPHSPRGLGAFCPLMSWQRVAFGGYHGALQGLSPAGEPGCGDRAPPHTPWAPESCTPGAWVPRDPVLSWGNAVTPGCSGAAALAGGWVGHPRGSHARGGHLGGPSRSPDLHEEAMGVEKGVDGQASQCPGPEL